MKLVSSVAVLVLGFLRYRKLLVYLMFVALILRIYQVVCSKRVLHAKSEHLHRDYSI